MRELYCIGSPRTSSCWNRPPRSPALVGGGDGSQDEKNRAVVADEATPLNPKFQTSSICSPKFCWRCFDYAPRREASEASLCDPVAHRRRSESRIRIVSAPTRVPTQSSLLPPKVPVREACFIATAKRIHGEWISSLLSQRHRVRRFHSHNQRLALHLLFPLQHLEIVLLICGMLINDE